MVKVANVRVCIIARNRQLNVIRDLIDAGADAGKMKIYSGEQPANADASVVNNRLLAVPRFALTSAPDAFDGVLEFSMMEEIPAVENGDASFARLTDSNDNSVLDLDVGTKRTSVILNTTQIKIGQPVRILSARLILPA